MKKIGFLTVSLIALMASGVAHAEIASVTYVDDAVATKQDKLTYTAENSANKTTTIAAAASASDDKYPSEKAVASALAGKMNNVTLATVATSGSYNDLTNKPNIPTGSLAAKSTIKNEDVAADAAIVPTKIAIETVDTYDKVSVAEKDKRIPSLAVVQAVAGTVADAAVDSAVDNIGKTYATKTELGDLKGKIGTVGENKTVVEMISDAVSGATGEDSALAGRVKTIEDSAVMKSNADATKIAAIATNTSEINALKNDKQAKSTEAYQMGGANGTWTTMSTAQQAALNSGVTTAVVSAANSAVQPSAISNMQTTTNMATAASAVAGDKGSTDKYPSVAAAEAIATAAANAVAGDVTSLTDRVGSLESENTTNKAGIAANSQGISTINASAVMTSGATKAKIDAIATNTTNITAVTDKVNNATNGLDSKLATATYNSQIGTVSATDMGTTASTVVAAISEVNTTAKNAASAASAAQTTANSAKSTADLAIPKPSGSCTDCVLHYNGSTFSWEEIGRGTSK